MAEIVRSRAELVGLFPDNLVGAIAPSALRDLVASVASLCYPVGSIYTSVLDTNPSVLLGFGTWEAFGAGRALVGLDAGQPEFDTLLEEGGAKSVASAGSVAQPTFTGSPITDVPNHTHPVTITDPGHAHAQRYHAAATGPLSGPTTVPDASSNTPTNYALTTATAATGITAAAGNPAGGVASVTPTGTVSQPGFTGSPTSVVQPYVVVRLWRRTA